MRKLKLLITISLLALLLTSCLRLEVGVNLKNGSMTIKYAIEEDLYKMVNSDGEYSDYTLDEKLSEKEGENYYSKTETKKGLSDDEIVTALSELEIEEGTPIFSFVDIKRNGGTCEFIAETNIIDPEDLETSTPGNASSDWLIIDVVVTMPGDISETTGEVEGKNAVRFSTSDASTSALMQAKSSSNVLAIVSIVLLIFSVLAAIAFTGIWFYCKRTGRLFKPFNRQ